MAKNDNGAILGFEGKLWDAANRLWANSGLKPSEFAPPVLGLIFLKYADIKFTRAQKLIEAKGKGSRRQIGKVDYQAANALYLPPKSRFSYVLNLPQGTNLGKALNAAMKDIEAENPDITGTLPKSYNQLDNDLLAELLKSTNSLPQDIETDAFGRIYEYFLSKFAMAEGQKGGEFFTPTCLVRLIVEIIEPYHGKIYDPACGSGGMFVQSAEFVAEHKRQPGSEISIYGQEKTGATVNLAKMNLAVHGLSGDVRETNTFYSDLHKSVGKFDFCMANPPFNMKSVDKTKLKDDKRFPFGLASVNNANYLWIQIFYSSLKSTGKAGFVMANSAADAGKSEQLIRKQIIEQKCVDCIVAIGPNFFYTVTLPCTLWFFDKGKAKSDRADKVLFIDAREIYNQIDRAHREFTKEDIEFIANIARLYRGEKCEFAHGTEKRLLEVFPNQKYQDIPGLCKIATISEIAKQDYSLNPGRFVGITEKQEEQTDFYEDLAQLNAEFQSLTAEAHKLEKQISANVNELLER